MSETAADPRELRATPTNQVAAPVLPWQPPTPRHWRPRIGLIGCGGISKSHLEAYRKQGWQVTALCDVNPDAARERQQAFYPGAAVLTDYRQLLDRDDVDVVDLATHPEVRLPQIRDALEAGKHVLSQKPFCWDLSEGKRLVDLAAARGLRLAVNQNGRWAPYFSYLRALVKAGRLGTVTSVDMTLAWDHSWVTGTAFEQLPQLILSDFAIHWFDMAACLFAPRRAESVVAAVARAPGQEAAPPLCAQAMVGFPGGQATLAFRGHTRIGNVEQLLVTGTQGIYQASGAVCAADAIRLVTAYGEARPQLDGQWFPDGMAGAMGELLCAIEEDREPENSAAGNLQSLALCLAAIRSAESGQFERPETF